MKNYSQLTLAQRYELERLLSNNLSKSEIAIELDVNPSSIYRELKRNSDHRDNRYYASLAQRKAEMRHTNKAKRVLFTPSIKQEVIELLKEDYSPEQIVGSLKKDNKASVSHERIYQFIWSDKKNKGHYYKHLRNRGKRYRKRGAKKDSRGLISNRIAISKRPKIVDKKSRLGDLEVDTIIGKNHKGAIVTINDRVSGMLKMEYVASREAKEVADVIINQLEDWKPFIKTITSDNGKEFADHQRIAEQLNIDFFFADPYHSWQRGANENLNGLIRQYLPKKTNFETIEKDYISEITEKLNRRPRKRFNFDNPVTIFAKKVNEINFLHL